MNCCLSYVSILDNTLLKNKNVSVLDDDFVMFTNPLHDAIFVLQWDYGISSERPSRAGWRFRPYY
jgi:hypothetical protein